MTSIPASLSARAITFAPRSCPSSPTLAITTRVLRTIGAAVYGRAADRRWLLTCLPEPPRGARRLPRRGRRPPHPARLRARCARPAARAGRRLAPGERGRHHALAPRPLGRPRAMGLGQPRRARARPAAGRALAAAGG